MVLGGILDTRLTLVCSPVGWVFEFANNHQCSAESEEHCQEEFFFFWLHSIWK